MLWEKYLTANSALFTCWSLNVPWESLVFGPKDQNDELKCSVELKVTSELGGNYFVDWLFPNYTSFSHISLKILTKLYLDCNRFWKASFRSQTFIHSFCLTLVTTLFCNQPSADVNSYVGYALFISVNKPRVCWWTWNNDWSDGSFATGECKNTFDTDMWWERKTDATALKTEDIMADLFCSDIVQHL